MDTLKDIKATIKKIEGMRDSVRKGLGLAKLEAVTPEDMYRFEYFKPEIEHKQWLILHGKCIGLGQKELIGWGYEFLQVGNFEKSDKTKARVSCTHCGELLDAATAQNYEKVRNEQLALRKVEYQEEREIREEWEAEQILLGKL